MQTELQSFQRQVTARESELEAVRAEAAKEKEELLINFKKKTNSVLSRMQTDSQQSQQGLIE